MKKSILFGNESRQQLLIGINTITDAVACTLGPGGRNVLFEKGPRTIVTKDGVSVAREISLEDEQQNAGVKIIQKACEDTLRKVGDGTTTTAIVTREIFREGLIAREEGKINPIKLKRSLDRLSKNAVDFLEENKVDCKTLEALTTVTEISANGDVEIGKIVAEAVMNSGEHGSITIRRKSSATMLELVPSIKVDKGLFAPQVIQFAPRDIIKTKNGYLHLGESVVILIRGKLTQVPKLQKLFEYVSTLEKPLVIVAEKFSDNVVDVFLKNLRAGYPFFLLESPSYGPHVETHLEDLSIALNVPVVSEEKLLERPNLLDREFGYKTYLAEVDDVMLGITESFILPNKSKQDENKINKQVKFLEETIKNTTAPYDLKTLKDRISSISGISSVIHIKANSDTEEKEIEDRIDDARCSAISAFKNGIIAGGGISLIHSIIHVTENFDIKTDEDKMALSILYKSFCKPLVQINENLGNDEFDILNACILIAKNGYPFDDKNFNLVKQGVIDPFDVTKNVIETSVSHAGTLLTTECSIMFKQE